MYDELARKMICLQLPYGKPHHNYENYGSKARTYILQMRFDRYSSTEKVICTTLQTRAFSCCKTERKKRPTVRLYQEETEIQKEPVSSIFNLKNQKSIAVKTQSHKNYSSLMKPPKLTVKKNKKKKIT